MQIVGLLKLLKRLFIEEIWARTGEAKESKLKVLKLKFQHFKQGPIENLKDLNSWFTIPMSKMTALGEGNRCSNAQRVKTIIQCLNQEWSHAQNFYYNQIPL